MMNADFVKYRLKRVEAVQSCDGFEFELVPVSDSLKFFVKSKDAGKILGAIASDMSKDIVVSLQKFDTGEQIRIGYGEWIWCNIDEG